MAISVPSWTNNSGPGSSLGNPADLGGYRGTQEARGQTYDERANEAYGWGVGQRDYLTDVGKGVTDQALDTSKTFSDWAKSDRAFWEGTYKPGMQSQMDYAMNYTTPERMAANRGAAMAGTSITFDAAGDMAKRALMGYGVDPSSGRYAGLDAGLSAKRAAAGAAAGTKSDRDTEMLGQEYLDRAIRTGAVLPGQAANEAGVSLAAGNAAANTAIATGDAGRRMTEPSAWVGAGDQALKEWKTSLLEQTQLGMRQNQDAQAAREAEEKRKASESSGVGAAIGAGMGILGTAAGAYFGGPMGASIGGKLGSSLGGAMGGGSGMTYERGGRVRRFQRGGVVTDVEEYADGGAVDDDPDVARARQFAEGLWSDGVPSYAEGGEVDDEFLPDDEMEEMPMEETPPSQETNVVPPEASPSGGEETDDVHALVNEGEFIIPKKVTNWFGEKYFQKLIEKAYTEMAGPKTAEPEAGPPVQAMAMSPPTFQSAGG